MEGRTVQRNKWIRMLRWIARVWSIASVALLLAFVVGEGIHPARGTEWLGLLFFPVGISLGMILAWRKEWLGGGITVASLLAFYASNLVTAGTFPKGWAFLAFTAPGFLFLLTAGVSRAFTAGADGTLVTPR